MADRRFHCMRSDAVDGSLCTDVSRFEFVRPDGGTVYKCMDSPIADQCVCRLLAVVEACLPRPLGAGRLTLCLPTHGHRRLMGGSAPTKQRKADADTASAAWKHLKSVVRDDGKGIDLFDLLISSQRETQYSFYPPGVRAPPMLALIIMCRSSGCASTPQW